MLRRILGAAVVAAIILFAAVVATGSLRYGSVEGLYRRVNAEIASQRPHPQIVPTPLPISEPTLRLASATASPAPDSGAATRGATSTRAQPQPEARVSPLPTAPPNNTATVITEPTPGQVEPARETPQVAPTPPPAPSSVRLSGLTHWWQTWNNCGPATLAMNLSYFGLRTSQAEAAAAIRPNKEDKNVSPDELAAFARAQGLQALARVNGDPDRLRRLLTCGIPVLVETWHEAEPGNGMGHYRLLTGYDDASQEWIAYDSYDAKGVDRKQPYAGIRIPYAELPPLWKVFNRQYVVIYSPELASRVEAAMGADSDDKAMWQRALDDARSAVELEPADAFAWFNLGSDLTALGRHREAVQAYDRARQIGLPWRMLWYQFGPFKSYYQVGRHDEVIALADATIRTATYVEELYYWRGLAQQAQGKATEARASFQRALVMNRNYAPAAEALAALPAP
jgi:tetratricopeptide (TPR) repeat protein